MPSCFRSTLLCAVSAVEGRPHPTERSDALYANDRTPVTGHSPRRRAIRLCSCRMNLIVPGTGDVMRGPVYDRSSVVSFNQSSALEVQAKEAGLEEEYHQPGTIQESAPNNNRKSSCQADCRHRLG